MTLESDWTPALGQALKDTLDVGADEEKLDIGCIAAHGHFCFSKASNGYEMHHGSKPATTFLFKLISQLQICGTVPMIDLQAYAQWLSKST